MLRVRPFPVPDPDDVLPLEVKRLSARHAQRDSRTTCQEFAQLRSGRQHVLIVVQDQEGLVITQILPKPFQKGRILSVPDTVGPGKRRQHLVRIADRGEVDEGDAIGKGLYHLVSSLKSAAGLFDASRTNQGEEADVLTERQLTDRLNLLHPVGERSQPNLAEY
jgi:hypothetical protein